MTAAAFEALATTAALATPVFAALAFVDGPGWLRARRIRRAVPGMSKTTARALARPNVHDEEVW